MTYNDLKNQCPAEGSGVHSWMMALANVGARSGVDPHEVADDIRAGMTRQPSPASEVSDTVEKAFRERGHDYVPDKKTPEEKAFEREQVARMQARSFINLAGKPITSRDLMDASPVDVQTVDGYEQHIAAKFLLYLYGRDELVWCGEMYDGKDGIQTVETWAERFLCLEKIPPQFIPNPLTGEPGTTKSGKQSFRCDDCVSDWRYALFEVDHPDITLGHQAAFWLRQINDPDGLPVESITYSGGKSLHALIRVDCKSEMEWDKKVRNGVFLDWMRIGADKSCRNPSRLSRLPGHKRAGGKEQKLLWLRGGK